MARLVLQASRIANAAGEPRFESIHVTDRSRQHLDFYFGVERNWWVVKGEPGQKIDPVNQFPANASPRMARLALQVSRIANAAGEPRFESVHATGTRPSSWLACYFG